MAQSKVTDYFQHRMSGNYRSPSPKRSKGEIKKSRTSSVLRSGTSSIAQSRTLSIAQSRTPSIAPSRTPSIAQSRTPSIARFFCAPDVVSVTLELPGTFSLLLNWFNSSDQLVSIMYNRQELISFSKLQDGVKKTTRRNFGLKELGQIKTVYPEAYEYEQLRMTRQAVVYQNRRQDYELTIRPNLILDLSTYGELTPVKSPRKRADVTTPTKNLVPPRTPVKRSLFAMSPTKTPTKSIAIPPILTTAAAAASPIRSPSKMVTIAGAAKPFTGGRLIARSQVFRRNLFGILRKRHTDFLATLSPPITLSEKEEGQLSFWHPEFLANIRAVEIEASSLPEAPAVEKIASARDLINVSSASLHPKLEAAIANMTKSTPEDACTSTEAPSAPSESPKTPSKPALKGIPPKLLEKIRERERQKKQLAMSRPPEEQIRRIRMSRLPEFVRIINMYYAAESKSVMPSDQVHKKLKDSYATPMSTAETIEHVNMLRDLVPDWISQTEIGEKGSYLRINRSIGVTDVLKVLSKKE